MLRVGLVGAGLIANVHAGAYAQLAGVEVAAVTDPVSAKAADLAARCGAEVLPDVARLIDLELDLVDVCTPPHTHAEIVIAALDAGHNVACEKPIARTLADARRMVAADRRTPGLLMVGHVTRYEADHRLAKQLVDDRQVGRLRRVAHSTTTSAPGWSEGGWLADPRCSGGPVLDQGVHSFDYLRWLIGSPAIRVHAVGRDTAAGPGSYVLTTVRYADGTIGVVETSWAHPAARGFRLQAELVGTDGRLAWSYDDLMSGVYCSADGGTEWYDALGDRGFVEELRDFTDALRTKVRRSPVPAAEATEGLHTALAALESLHTGEAIDLVTWEPE
jgi:predicted dehydrogenase